MGFHLAPNSETSWASPADPSALGRLAHALGAVGIAGEGEAAARVRIWRDERDDAQPPAQLEHQSGATSEPPWYTSATTPHALSSSYISCGVVAGFTATAV